MCVDNEEKQNKHKKEIYRERWRDRFILFLFFKVFVKTVECAKKKKRLPK